MDMESPLKYGTKKLPHQKYPLLLRKELSTYDFSTSTLQRLCFLTRVSDYPSTSQIAYTKRVTAPSPISDDDNDNDEDCEVAYEEQGIHTDNPELGRSVYFHGSACGVICFTINKLDKYDNFISKSNYFMWNPTIWKCCELPRIDFDTQVFGIGHRGEGKLEIVCVSGAGTVADPIVINCLDVSTGLWETIHNDDAVFMGTQPCYVGVAGDVLLWSYTSINSEFINSDLFFSGYNFRTRSIVTIQKPTLLPPNFQSLKLTLEQDWNPEQYFVVRFYVAGDCLWALGEARYHGFNFLRRYVGGAWETVLDSFEIPSAMVNALMGSTSDFTRLLFLTNEDHLLLFHAVLEGHPITFVDSPDPNGVDVPADSASQTIDFLDVQSIQFEESLFFPDFHVEEDASINQNEKCGDDSLVVQALGSEMP